VATNDTRRPPVALIALVVLAGALGVACSPRESSCGDEVVADWSDGRIDGVYPLHCYEAAVAGLPEDVRAYSSAADDIARALQERVRAQATRDRSSGVRTVSRSAPAGPGDPYPVLLPLVGLGVLGALGISALVVWIARRARGRS
jgi:hypothetical protein